jgi:hypothetical protein
MLNWKGIGTGTHYRKIKRRTQVVLLLTNVSVFLLGFVLLGMKVHFVEGFKFEVYALPADCKHVEYKGSCGNLA